MKLSTDKPKEVDYEVRSYTEGGNYDYVVCQTFIQAKVEALIREKAGDTDIEIVAQDPDEAIAWWTYKNGKAIRTE